MPTENYRSEEAYRKNLAYRHIHGIPMNAEKVCIKGKCLKVKHAGKKRTTKAKRKVVARKRG